MKQINMFSILVFFLAVNSAIGRVLNNLQTNDSYIRHKEVFTFNDDMYRDNYLLNNNLKYCTRKAKCVSLESSKCMGAKLPYHSTTLALIDLETQTEVQEKLQLYEQYLRYIPKCWAVIQPFLCALYMPKCEHDLVHLPSKEMCRITLEPCKIIYNSTVFPELFNCEDEKFYPSNCRNDIREMKFNTTGYCMEPLIKTDKSGWWFKGVEDCGLHCRDSLYTDNENRQIHKLIGYCALLCIVLNLFTVITFIIDWKTANKYPAKAIFYVNICFAISYSGWLIQFLSNDTREDIVCKKDGTLRISEPSATENLSCVIVFFMIYYFLIAGFVWFMIFAYAWYMNSLQALGKTQERVYKKRAYFHLFAWSLPLILMIITMTIGEIDANYTLGICFVGFVNIAAKAGLLLAPLIVTILTSVYIIIRGLILLIKVKIESKEVISENSSRKIQSNIVRMTVFTIFMLLFCAVTVGYHVYVASNRHLWYSSLEKYILCKLTSFSTDHSHCKQVNRPSVAMLQLQLLAIFGNGIAMASWIWCEATIHAWTRYIRRKFHCEKDEPMKIQKHKIIARAFAKRKKFNEGGRISIFSQNHSDPVGLQFDLNSAASNELSTTWAKNLPRLVNRRQAVPNEVIPTDISLDSDFSLNYRHVSIESRRNSGDSQVSVQFAELKATRKVNSRRHRRHNKHTFRKASKNIGNSHNHSQGTNKKGSSGSLDSYLQIFNALTNGSNVCNFHPNLDRRSANAGLDGVNLEQILSKRKIGSEDENVSVTISESTINMRLANPTLDLNDRFTIKQLKQGFNITGMETSESDEDSQKDYETAKIYSVNEKDSHSSKKFTKKYKRSRVQDDSDSDHQSDSASYLENEFLHSPETSTGCEKNRGSRLSKASMDVAVQANAHDLDLEMSKSKDKEILVKSKQVKTLENKKYRKSNKEMCNKKDYNKNIERIEKSKEKYKNEGTSDEKQKIFQFSDEACGSFSID